MKTKKLLLFAAIIFCSFKSYSQSYDMAGLTQNGFVYDTIQIESDTLHFNFSGITPGGYNNAELTVYWAGDFGSSSELFTVYESTTNTVIGTGGDTPNFNDCLAQDSVFFYFPTVNLYTWQVAGNVSFYIVTSANVNTFCSEQRMRADLKFDYCPFGTPTYADLTLSNNIACPYEPIILSGTPSGGTFTGTGVTGNMFDGSNLAPGTYTITYTATDGIGCTTSDTETLKLFDAPADQSFTVCENGDSPVLNPGTNTYVYSIDNTFSNPLDTANNFTFGPVTSSPTTLYFADYITLDQFTIDTSYIVVNNNVNYQALTTYFNDGIAVDSQYVYVIGDDAIARFDLDLQNPGVSLTRRDGLFSDLKTNKLWSIYNTTYNNSPTNYPNIFIFEVMRGLDSNMNFTSEIITLSTPIELGDNINNNVIFSGYGYLGVYSGSTGKVSVVSMSTGEVTDLGVKNIANYYGYNWADWGNLGYDGADFIAYYRDYNSGQIIAHNMTDNSVTDVTDINDLGNLASFTYSTVNNRLYYNYNAYSGNSLGGSGATVGYIDADVTLNEDMNGKYGCYAEINLDFNTVDLGPDTTACNGNGSVILSPGFGYNSYTWNGVNNNWNVFPASNDGLYVVNVVDNSNCVLTDSIMVTFQECLGLDELQLEDISLYPIPNNGEFTIKLSDFTSSMEVKIIDLSGKIVGEYNYTEVSNSTLVNAEHVITGMYIVNVKTENGNKRFTISVIK